VYYKSILSLVGLLVVQGFTLEMPRVSKVGFGYYQYMNHWTGAEKQSFLWKERTELGRSESPGQNLRILVGDVEFKLPFKSFLKLKMGYHFNDVLDYELKPSDFGLNASSPKKRESRGFEDIEILMGHDINGVKVGVKYFSPYLAEAEPQEGSYADSWSGFGAHRIGVEFETVQWNTWLNFQSHMVIAEGEFSRVQTGGFDIKGMGFQGVPLSELWKLHYGVIASYQAYEWYKYLPATSNRKVAEVFANKGALQREFQIEPHFGIALSAMGLEYKIDLAFTLYGGVFSEFEAEEPIVFDSEGALIDYQGEERDVNPMSGWTDASRQLIFGLSVNKYF
jgi:hypothetical protein